MRPRSHELSMVHEGRAVNHVSTTSEEMRLETVETTHRPGPMQAMAAGMLMGIANGYCRTQLLAVAARLGVADVLAGGPSTGDELAAATDAKPEPLRRGMRGLAAVGG